MKRAAMYVRVSTDRQTVQNQIARLTEIAVGRGWQIVQTFSDAGISGAKGRSERPSFDEMLKQAQRHRFDVIMVWAIDRIGRSLIDLLEPSSIWKRAASICTSISKRSILPRLRAS
jgi:DNA invertase Pin-like site-specific DNA recombinase